MPINLLKTNGDNLLMSYSKEKINGPNLCYINSNLNPKEKDNSSNINNKSNKSIIKYNDLEINTLGYKEALIIDKRTYFIYYFSLLKSKHLILLTFYTRNDYNSPVIKICLFLFTFGLYITVNALFFNDSTMHKIYIDEGKYNLSYLIPKIIYSFIISNIISLFIRYLSLTENDVVKIKKGNKKFEQFIKSFKIKFILFFLLSFIFLIIFWYYLTCFYAVYQNTQKKLFCDTVISFSISLIYPFGFYLLPGLFRIPALSKPNSGCLYEFSKLIQIL